MATTGLAQQTNPFSPAAIAKAVPLAPNPNTVGIKTNTAPLALGIKAAAPTAPAKTNTLTKSQTAPAVTSTSQSKPSVTNSTESGVQNTTQTVPQYGSTFYDPKTGQASGTNQFDPNTGKPLSNPNVTQSTTANSTAANNQNPTFTQAVGGLAGANLANKAITDNTANQANQINDEIVDLRQGANNTENAYATSGMITPRSQGLAQNVAQTEAAQESTLNNQFANQLAIGNQGLAGQAQTQSAEQAAGSLSAPQVTSYGQTSFNPTTGQFDGGGSLPTAVLQQYAQMAANGQYSAIPATITGNPVLSAQLNAAALQINPNYNPIASQAQGATQASNIQTLGTAPVNAEASNIQTSGTANTQTNASGYATTLPAYTSANASFSTADKQANSLLNVLNSTGINSKSDATDWNLTQNQLAGKLGSTNMAQYTTALTEAQSAYTSLLASTGAGTPTSNVSQALATLSPKSTPAQIAASINTLNQAAYNKLEPQYQQALSYYNNLHGTNATEIPGNPAPTLPTPIVVPSSNKNGNFSLLNIDKEIVGAGIQGIESVGGAVADFIGKIF